jgi:LysM repeat protein
MSADAVTPQPKKKRNPSSGRKKEKTEWYFWLIGGVISLLILVLFAMGGLFVFYQQMQLILPAVTVGPLPVGSTSIAAAAQEIDQYWNSKPHFLVEDGEHQWQITLPNIGIWVDPGLTAQEAFNVGRGEGGLQQIQQILINNQYSVQPVVKFDRQLAEDVFNELARRINIPAENAALIQTAEGEWDALPGKPGLALDVESAIDLIQSDPLAVVNLGYLTLSMQPVQPEINDLSGELDRIAAYYQKPLNVSAYDPITDETLNWTVPQDLVSGWIKLDDPYGDPYLEVDEAQFLAYLDEWEASLENQKIDQLSSLENLNELWQAEKPFTLTLRQSATTYTVQPGQNLISIAFQVGMPYWKIQEANPGTSLYGITPGQVLTIPSKNEMLPLPVVTNKRIVINISQQHMWLYENGEMISEHVISTGMSSSPTLPGIFQVQTHEVNAYASNWDLWMPHFLGIYEAVPGFMNGIHGLPVLSSGVRLWGNVLGTPASYGCIITDLPTSTRLFDWAEAGVVVEIQA